MSRGAGRGGLLAVLVVLASGCAVGAPPAVDPPTARAVDRTETVPTAAGERRALVHHPASAGPGAPLVVVLHGAGGTGEFVRGLFGWDPLADRSGFVVAYPDGLETKWNSGRCCASPAGRTVDDVGFVSELSHRLAAEEGADPRAVYAVGISNGAMLAYDWACSRPGELAGIGVVAGALVADCPAPAPLRVVAVHGTADDVVPIAGGAGRGGTDFPPLDGSLAPFRAAAGCPDRPQVVVTGPATVATWRCPGGHDVVRDVIDGIGHVWPRGALPGAGGSPLDATGFLWTQLRPGP